MKTISITLYDFNELSVESKKKVIELYKCTDDFNINCDNVLDDLNNSEKAYFKFFCNTKEYKELTSNNFNYINGLKLRNRLINKCYDLLYKPKYLGIVNNKSIYSKINVTNDCVLTGTYTDYVILKSLYDFLERTDYSSVEYSNLSIYDILPNTYTAINEFYNDTINNEDNLSIWINNYCIDNNFMFMENGTFYKL